MELTEIYRKGEATLPVRDIGRLLNGVETGFVLSNNRRVLGQYTIKQRCIDGVEAASQCTVMGVALSTPVIMSMTGAPGPRKVSRDLLIEN